MCACVHVIDVAMNLSCLPQGLHTSREAQERGSFLATQLIWTVCLLTLTYLRLCSAFVFLLWVAFPLTLQGLPWYFCLRTAIDRNKHKTVWNLTHVVLSALGIGLPFMLCMQLVDGVFAMFVPLTGRSGSSVPPDLAIGGLAAAHVCLICPYMVSTILCTYNYITPSLPHFFALLWDATQLVSV